jgi:beta-lactamase class A
MGRSGGVDGPILEVFPARGRIGVLIRDDRSGNVVVDHRADDPFESASMIKLGVLAVLAAEIAEGGLDPDAPVAVLEADRAPGDGLLRLLALPARWSVRDLAVAMTVLSDNTATNTLLRVMGVERINERLSGWGFAVTRSRGPIRSRPPGAPGIGITTARECVALLDGLRLGSFAGRAESAWAIEVLAGQQDDRAMSRYLAEGIRCAHKTGTVDGLRHDAGVLFGPHGGPVATLAFLTDHLGPSVERHDHPACRAIAEATVRTIRELRLPVQLAPWAPDPPGEDRAR